MNNINKIVMIALLLMLLPTIFSPDNAFAYSPSNGPYIFFPLVIILFYAIIFSVWIAVAYWGYKDAEKRGQNGLLWAIVIFFGGLIGIIVYLIIRDNFKPETPGRICPNCNRPIPEDANICPYCAKRFDTYV